MHFAGYFLGFTPRRYEKDGVEFTVAAEPHCTNADGIVHRAAMLFSADMALAAANRVHIDPNVRTATLMLRVEFTGEPAIGTLKAVCQGSGFLPRTALPESFASGHLTAGGREVMRMSGTWVAPPAPPGRVMSGLPWEGGENGHMRPLLKKNELEALGDVKKLQLSIFSEGGDVFTGMAMHNLLVRHPAKKRFAMGLRPTITFQPRIHRSKIELPEKLGQNISHHESGSTETLQTNGAVRPMGVNQASLSCQNKNAGALFQMVVGRNHLAYKIHAGARGLHCGFLAALQHGRTTKKPKLSFGIEFPHRTRRKFQLDIFAVDVNCCLILGGDDFSGANAGATLFLHGNHDRFILFFRLFVFCFRGNFLMRPVRQNFRTHTISG